MVDILRCRIRNRRDGYDGDLVSGRSSKLSKNTMSYMQISSLFVLFKCVLDIGRYRALEYLSWLAILEKNKSRYSRDLKLSC